MSFKYQFFVGILLLAFLGGAFLYSVGMDPNITAAVVVDSRYSVRKLPSFVWLIFGAMVIISIIVGIFMRKKEKDPFELYEQSFEKPGEENKFDFE